MIQLTFSIMGLEMSFYTTLTQHFIPWFYACVVLELSWYFYVFFRNWNLSSTHHEQGQLSSCKNVRKRSPETSEMSGASGREWMEYLYISRYRLLEEGSTPSLTQRPLHVRVACHCTASRGHWPDCFLVKWKVKGSSLCSDGCEYEDRDFLGRRLSTGAGVACLPEQASSYRSLLSVHSFGRDLRSAQPTASSGCG